MIDVINCITQVELVLLDVLALAFQTRTSPQVSLAALKAAFAPTVSSPQNALTVPHRALCYVAAEDRVYKWDVYNTQPDDGLAVIAPASSPPAGRWLRMSSPAYFGPNTHLPLQSRQTGVCRAVELYEGGAAAEQQFERVFGVRPALLLQFSGDDPKPQSLFAGALYRSRLSFQVLIASECLRPPHGTQTGSALPAESTRDPGINSLIGQIRKVLAGVPLGIPGLEHVEIGPSSKVFEDLEERLLIYGLDFFVRVSFEIPDEDLEPFAAQVTPRLADTARGAARFDPTNYVAQGYTVQPGPGLARTYTLGIAFIGGAVVSSTPPPVTFAADSETYRDLDPAGGLTYTAVPPGDPPPLLAPGSLRIAVTRTDASSVVSDTWLCGFSVQYSPPIAVPPP